VASNLAMLAAWLLRFRFEIIPVTKGPQQLSTYAYLLPIVTIVFPLAFAVQGLYRIRPTRSKAEEWMSVAIGSVVATVVLSGVLLWIRAPKRPDVLYSRATLGIFMLCAIFFVIFGRGIVRYAVERRHRKGKSLDRVLIAGNGELARAVVERMRSHDELGFRIVGYLRNGGDDLLEDLECFGKIDDVETVIERQSIDHVFVALPHASSQMMTSLLDRLVRCMVSIHVVPDLLQFMVLDRKSVV